MKSKIKIFMICSLMLMMLGRNKVLRSSDWGGEGFKALWGASKPSMFQSLKQHVGLTKEWFPATKTFLKPVAILGTLAVGVGATGYYTRKQYRLSIFNRVKNASKARASDLTAVVLDKNTEQDTKIKNNFDNEINNKTQKINRDKQVYCINEGSGRKNKYVSGRFIVVLSENKVGDVYFIEPKMLNPTKTEKLLYSKVSIFELFVHHLAAETKTKQYIVLQNFENIFDDDKTLSNFISEFACKLPTNIYLVFTTTNGDVVESINNMISANSDSDCIELIQLGVQQRTTQVITQGISEENVKSREEQARRQGYNQGYQEGYNAMQNLANAYIRNNTSVKSMSNPSFNTYLETHKQQETETSSRETTSPQIFPQNPYSQPSPQTYTTTINPPPYSSTYQTQTPH